MNFSKYHTAGNDFIFIDGKNIEEEGRSPSFIQSLCRRKFGIGADGVVIVDKDPSADFWMRIYNPDGLEADGCGNALCSLFLFLKELGAPDKEYSIRMGDKIVKGSFDGMYARIDMGRPADLRFQMDGENIHYVHTGAPHLVHFVEDVDSYELETKGKNLRFHPLLMPKGSNVNVAQIETSEKIKVRTFERGVERETLACGTGAVAVALIASILYGMKMPIELKFSGGSLLVEKDKENLILQGKGHKVFSGIYGTST